MSGQVASRAAWAVAVSTALAFAGGALLSSMGDRAPGIDEAIYLTIALVLATVGALVVARVPSYSIGWILSGVSLYVGVTALADGYVTR